MRRVSGLALALWMVAMPAAAAPPADDPYEVGIRVLDQGEWTQALPIYQRITRENPAYAWGWMGLGWSLHYTGDFQGALPAYRRALQLGALPPFRVWLEMARCHAALGAGDSTYAALEQALAAGLTHLDRLADDSRLDLVRHETRFRDLMGLPDTTLDRTAGWRRDLVLLSRQVKRVHYAPFRAIGEPEFDRAIAAISDSVPQLDDDALAVRVMRLVARLGDGHTWAEPPFLQDATEETVPVLFGQFDDGLFVTAVRPGHEALLWSQVVEVEGVPADRMLARMDPLVSKDNPMRLLSVGPQHLRHPRLLRALGLIRSSSAMDLRVRDRRGRLRNVHLDAASGAVGEWVREPSGPGARRPEYARRRTDWYWFEAWPDSSTLYLQYNACAEKDSESVEAFAGRLLRFVDEHDVRRMIVDLRHNGGGNLFLNRPLLEVIVQSRKVNQPGRLFVIASRHTFSAGMSFAAQLERYTHAVFVGEPTGSSPNFVGETNVVTLPHSRIRVSLSNLAWQNSFAQDRRIWIAPRIPVPWTFASYREGRDPALEAILAFGR